MNMLSFVPYLSEGQVVSFSVGNFREAQISRSV
jgi:hypothetical protein